MGFKPNYNQKRRDRERAKEQKKQEKRLKKQEATEKRKAERDDTPVAGGDGETAPR